MLSFRAVFVSSALLAGSLGCGDASTPPEPPPLAPAEPTLQYDNLAFLQVPGWLALAAYYCPTRYDALSCTFLLGPPPSLESLRYIAHLRLVARNEGEMATTLTGLGVAIELFPGTDQNVLSSTCISFCDEVDVACTALPAECPEGTEVVDPLEFAFLAPAFVLTEVLLLGLVDLDVAEYLKRKRLVGGDARTVNLLVELDRDTLMELERAAIETALDQSLQQGTIVAPVRSDIPTATGAVGLFVSDDGTEETVTVDPAPDLLTL